jgi:ABC-type polysaccharide/polyol phosphate transport system ATPase subunit
MSSDEIAISVRNLTKTYRIFGHPGDRIKQAATFGIKRYYKKFTALRDVSFDIKKGETVGIIGRNGSGKSTLLQLICGILKPTSGSVQVNGRVSALLELGAGFNPEFTGRENVYFQGAIMGLSHAQMDARFDEIAAFADISEFVDQPVRIYSSGMFVRLAFAAAVHVDPDVLVVDEVLAVGDAVYQQKCFDRIRRLQSQGTSIIVVSHNPYQIERLCHRAAVMRQGVLSPLQPARDVLALYHEMAQQELAPGSPPDEASREGTHALCFERVYVENERDDPADALPTMEALQIVAVVRAREPVDGVRFRFEICTAGNEVAAMVTTIGLTESRRYEGHHRIAFNMTPCRLTSGWYSVNAIAVGRDVRLDTWPRAAEFRVLLKDEAARRLSSDNGIFVCQGEWALS